jgi:intraflagellar transport protein 52
MSMSRSTRGTSAGKRSERLESASKSRASPTNEDLDPNPPAAGTGPIILFNQSHNEIKNIQGTYKSLNSKLRNQYKIIVNNKDELTKERINQLQPKLIVLAGPRTALTANEELSLRDYMIAGGCVLILAGEGALNESSQEFDNFTHLNNFLSQFSIEINNDALIRTIYAPEYFHPKEALVNNATVLSKLDQYAPRQSSAEEEEDYSHSKQKLSIVYPYGCTLNISRPALPLITSGSICFPANRPLCAVSKVSKGLICVLGTFNIFDDSYINRADNQFFATGLFSLLIQGFAASFNEKIDEDRPEYGEIVSVPDTEALAERLRSCLQETEELPVDFTVLFDHNLFKYDTNLVPEAIKLYEKLNVKHETLSLIPPQFEVPLPPLQPAVFMPTMREAAPPALDLFDLDEHFSTDKLRLNQLTNKCTDNDLDYYCREAGEILAIADIIREEATTEEKESGAERYTANKVLAYVLKKLVQYKKFDQDADNLNIGSDVYNQHHHDADVLSMANDQDNNSASQQLNLGSVAEADEEEQ